ncbi:hypothetical protein PPGU19_045260 [Paraburkholderia sp. PGU19]|nr:hypothetical protein PPGU19_045260 [Paraburkholderia sp. PGU19]
MELTHGYLDPIGQFLHAQRSPDVLLHQMNDSPHPGMRHGLGAGRMRLWRARALRVFNQKDTQRFLNGRNIDMPLQDRRCHIDGSATTRARDAAPIDRKEPVGDKPAFVDMWKAFNVVPVVKPADAHTMSIHHTCA